MDRYAQRGGYDPGPLARKKYVDLIVQKAGIIPGDWVLDVQTGDGLLGVNVARAFTKAKVVATDESRANLDAARRNAEAERCAARLRFVQCAADALPFKEESVWFATIGFDLPEGVGELSVLEDVHRALGFSAKVYAPSLEYPEGRPRPEGVTPWLFDGEGIEQVREIGFGKIQKQRIALLPDGGKLHLAMMKRFDVEEDEEEGDEDAE